jgi:hypothetical protein
MENDLMTSTAAINAVTDAVISRLNSNVVALGNFIAIKERDQEPSVLADHVNLTPVLVVMPLSNRSDNMRMTMGTTGEVYHRFTLTITGYYAFDDLTTSIRTLRGYAYTCFDLFRGSNQQVAAAYITGASVNPGYFVMVDKPIYKWNVTLNFYMLEDVP